MNEKGSKLLSEIRDIFFRNESFIFDYMNSPPESKILQEIAQFVYDSLLSEMKRIMEREGLRKKLIDKVKEDIRGEISSIEVKYGVSVSYRLI